MKYQITVRFERLNSEGKLEMSIREAVFEAKTGEIAKEKYLKQFKKNEPNRRKIHSVTVSKVKES